MLKAEEKLFVLPTILQPLLRSRVTWILSATILCLFAYSNGFNGELVHDDIFAIRDNADVRPATPLAQLFSNDFWGEPMSSDTSHKSYRPLTVLSFRLNYLAHGLEPVGYHVVNVGLHIVATLLLGCVCRCVLRGGVEAAFLAMCLFAVHPVHTEAVTGIVGRADVMACILFLLSLLLYWSFTTPLNQQAALKAAKFTGCVLAGAAAMLSKEHGATVLGVCLAYEVLVVRGRALANYLSKKTLPMTELRPLAVHSLLLSLSAGVLLLTRLWLLYGKLPAFSRQDNPASFAESSLTRALSYSNLFYFNAKLMVYPAVLCYDYQMGSIELVESLTDVQNVTTAIFYLVFCCLLWRGLYESFNGRHGNSCVTIMGLLLVVVPFLPASNLFIRVGFVVAERILYIPSAGYCILVASGGVILARQFRALRPIILLLFLLLLCSFIARTLVRNPVWSTRESLFRSGLDTIPHNAKIHFNYANFLKDSGRREEAIQHYKTAVRLWPEHAVSHNNLGTLLTNLTVAEAHYRAAVRYKPGHYRALYNLGSNLVQQGRLQEAEESFHKSLAVNPSYTDSLVGLALLLADQGRLEEGRGFIEQAASIAPDSADVWSHLGTYFLRIDRVDEAIEAFQRALRADTAHFPAMVGLARAHRNHRENDEAETWFKRALSLKEDPSTLHLLGAFYHNTGSLDQAAITFQRALLLDPGRADTVCSYCQTLLQLGRHGDVLQTAGDALRDHAPSSCLHSVLANTYIRRGELDKAEYHSSQAVDCATDKATEVEALRLHGGVLKDVGRLDQAEQVFRRAVEIAPDDPTSQLNLGALLHLLRNYPGARERYGLTLKLDPSNNLAKENLKKLDRLERKTTSK